ncbi:MAG: type II toxin-antitoxin system RelE/ParE family toxin [Chloroflexi bacterium]|nr:type II toxin-antitoxin system RelE/ParE family toxin [Chloroflexota bacterium]
MYSVQFLPSAARELSKLEPAVRRRLARRIDRLAQDPRAGAVKLRGAEHTWRVRVGDHRILYQIQDDRLLILVIRVAHRRDVYR